MTKFDKFSILLIFRLVVRGYRKPFKFEELYDLRWEEKSEYLVPKLMQAYYKAEEKEEEEKNRNGYSG